MAANTVTCIVISCDTCGEEQDCDGGTPHFASVAAAQKSLWADPLEDFTEWVIADNGDAACPHCRQRTECASAGHDWAYHKAYGGGRYCNRCGSYDHPEPGPGQLAFLGHESSADHG